MPLKNRFLQRKNRFLREFEIACHKFAVAKTLRWTWKPSKEHGNGQKPARKEATLGVGVLLNRCNEVLNLGTMLCHGRPCLKMLKKCPTIHFILSLSNLIC